MATNPINVICMKWGSRYDPTYVNRLRNMVRRNLNLKHRFICFTDDSRGIETDIEIKPLPDVRVPVGSEWSWQNKLGIFAQPLSDITGSVLWLDLDVVIVGQLDSFFQLPGPFRIIREYRTRPEEQHGNSSVFRFEAGAYPNVLKAFLADPLGVRSRFEGDQEFISSIFKPLSFWPEEWCPSFRRHCMYRTPLCYLLRPRIPPGAKIIVFHGFPKPPDAARGYFRFRSLKYCHPTPWIKEHWR